MTRQTCTLQRLATRCVIVTIVAALPVLSVVGAAPATEVYVIGSLYGLHARAPGYDLEALRRIVVAIDPQVLVLDCTPREIATRTVHASKIEYPEVIFPLMRERQYAVYPAEPDEPMFGEIVESIVEASQDLKRTRPEAAQAIEQFKKATDSVLTAYWQSPADAHDAITAQMLAAKEALQNRIIGPAAETGSIRWNRHWADSILRAARENPGRRILALTGIANRSPITLALKGATGIKVIDTTLWLRTHGASLTGR
jgi:hypothetical protein